MEVKIVIIAALRGKEPRHEVSDLMSRLGFYEFYNHINNHGGNWAIETWPAPHVSISVEMKEKVK